jgi:CheY-like chemotaxis protein
MALVLCTGVDKALLETRRYILEAAGHKVVTVSDETTLLDVCTKHAFDVAVIGQALSARIKRRIGMLVRENCADVKILELYPPHEGKSLDDADSWLEVPAVVPKELVDRVDQLAKSNGNKSSKSEKQTG